MPHRPALNHTEDATSNVSLSRQFTALAVRSAEDLVFGYAPQPVGCGFELVIGAGEVYPKVNFTLPPMMISEASWSQVLEQYEEMVAGILRPAVALRVPGIVLELEHLPPLTERPEWGAEITALLSGHLKKAHAVQGLRSALRVTPVTSCSRRGSRSGWIGSTRLSMSCPSTPRN